MVIDVATTAFPYKTSEINETGKTCKHKVVVNYNSFFRNRTLIQLKGNNTSTDPKVLTSILRGLEYSLRDIFVSFE